LPSWLFVLGESGRPEEKVGEIEIGYRGKGTQPLHSTRPPGEGDARILRYGRRRLVDLGFCGGSLGHNHGRRDYDSDERQTNQQIMHGEGSCVDSNELVHTLIIGRINNFLNPTKISIVTKRVLPECPPWCYP
jgi:hypothetical protein